MTGEQWEKLVAVINGRLLEPLPVGFIIDSPWLPGWAGVSAIDYFSSERIWFEANLKAIRRFPDCVFLPGFWSEFGMCTEPSAFGSKSSWPQNEPPHPAKILTDIKDVHSIRKPNPKTDGLLPFVLNRLKLNQPRIEREGHAIRFAVSRGPLNIASFLLGATEFLTAIRTNPAGAHKLLETTTDFIIDWLQLQAEAFPSIDGIFILDDIVGFLGDDDFRQAALPYLKKVFKSLDAKVKFFHNDAAGLVCAPYLPDIGINLFNFSFEHSLGEIKKLTNNSVTLLGNIPPRDVLAAGSPEDVQSSVRAALNSVPDKTRIIPSCGGGLAPDVPSRNLDAFLSAAKEGTK
ncbi:MAG TPA: uroporphyrinogen decarboxylase family protein [Sedimentisphaerales bacterium]|nr:uroporphyrinogen decarboxylase family protein [Sedimentisphaerales bacterium]